MSGAEIPIPSLDFVLYMSITYGMDGAPGVYIGHEKVAALFLGLFKPFFMGPGMLPIHMLTTPVPSRQSR